MDQPTTAFNFIPPDLEKAFKDGDHQAVDRISQAGAKDMDPVYANIQQHEDQGWVQIVNVSNNTPYWISIGGDPANPSGYMWTYTDPALTKTLSADSSDDPGYVHTVQVGTLSRNTKFLGISNQLIAGTAFAEALTQATLKAGQALITRGIVTEASWLAGGVFAAKFVGGALAGAALTLLLMFIAEFLYREYKCCINKYNWSDKSLVVAAYWGDNERIDNDQYFVRGALPSASTTITMPDGTKAPTTGSTVVSYSTYVSCNENKLLEGLGVAMSVASNSDDKGVLLGYYLGRFKDNKIALSGNTSQSLSDFYKNSDS
ncbi:hypothetical protein N0V94_006966 [Neodidymelliopsis sp. IMI 364377]|nr:hypothetical protein N0V94_006966 [Neodidymelliopsis sp. IMI 364377]